MTAVVRRNEGIEHSRQTWWAGYAVVVGGGLLIAAIARRRVTEPFLGVSLAVIVILLLGWLIRPRATLYAILFLTAVSDQVTLRWFPFTKNLSSRESISYVSDAMTVSPLEIALYLGVAVSFIRRYAHTRTLMAPTPLTTPLLVFTSFVAYGFARGVMSGGDLRIAFLEGRAMFYIFLVFAIVVNECSDHLHLRAALLAVLAGVVVQSLLSIEYLSRLDPARRDSLDSLNEHGSAIGQNLLIIVFIGLVLLRINAPLLKWTLLLGLVPTVYVFFVAQRRAGVAALVVTGALVAVALFWRRRRTFWMVTPLVTIILVGYVGAFWNSTSSLGFPAQAIKTIVAPDSATDKDRSSDIYRQTEAYDLNFTIRSNPVLGLGFGHAFYRPVPLPNISFFELSAYLSHNSVLWVWIKTGFGGFAAMFYLFGKAVLLGADRVRRAAYGIDLVVALAATCFVVMYAVYSYVDISWDARNAVILGLAMAVCGGSVPVRPDEDEPDQSDPMAVAEHVGADGPTRRANDRSTRWSGAASMTSP